jgi:hypothetical protein
LAILSDAATGREACLITGLTVKKTILLVGAALMLAACAGPKVTRTQPLAESADAPYDNVLVVSLFSSFDMRRLLEREIVKQLKSQGIDAVPSTSLISVKTPLNRESVLAAVEQANSDAVLVTQLLGGESSFKVRDRRPESTYNVRPTYYYNVWDLELTEYSEPPGLQAEHELTMATQVFSVRTKEPVWTIETRSKLKRNIDRQFSGTSISDEANAIAGAMARDGLLAR